MAIERFTWATEKGAEGDITQRVRTKKFGDGYEQAVEDGLNNQSESWPVTFTGMAARILEIRKFLDKHKGAKVFLWTPPLGVLGLYKCNGYMPETGTMLPIWCNSFHSRFPRSVVSFFERYFTVSAV